MLLYWKSERGKSAQQPKWRQPLAVAAQQLATPSASADRRPQDIIRVRTYDTYESGRRTRVPRSDIKSHLP